MTKIQEFDAIVIGTGPGGEGAAMGLSKHDLRVAVIERYPLVGGGCTHWGTIPSKALREAVSQVIDLKTNPLFHEYARDINISLSDILRHAHHVINQQTNMRRSFYDRNDCQLFTGQASFIDPHTVAVKYSDGSQEQLRASNIVIATGSSPYHPPSVDFHHPRIYDSDTILQLEHKPRHIIIYGAGVIGCEYASIFKGLGVKVDLINTRDRLLAFLDHEMSEALSYHFWNNGIMIRHNEEFESIQGLDDGVVLNLKSGKKMKADCLLFANGRTGNTQNLGLEHIGLTVNRRGSITVNDVCQTTFSHIYAVGDVIGSPGLASASYDQGRLVAQVIAKGTHTMSGFDDIPTGIYTIPEISSIGKTEQQLTAEQIPYEVGRAQFKHMARAQIVGMNIGSLKILFHRETREILGIHCFGEQAAEIIHIGQAIMEQPCGANTIDYFINTTFNYPTMAEAYRVAALNGINRLF